MPAATETALSDDDLPDLPWLKGVADDADEEEAGPSRGRILGPLVAIAAIAIVALGLYFMATRRPVAPVETAETVEQTTTESVTTEPTAPPPTPPATPARERVRVTERTVEKAEPPIRQGSGLPTIQLASFYTRDRAEIFWKQFEKRHKNVARLQHRVTTGTVNGRTVYRVRAEGSRAFEACASLRQRRVPCLQIGH